MSVVGATVVGVVVVVVVVVLVVVVSVSLSSLWAASLSPSGCDQIWPVIISYGGSGQLRLVVAIDG